MRRFRDRAEAGTELAAKLVSYQGRSGLLVLALPRGGVPVGYEVARRLGAPLDAFVVRKLGVPGHEELAMGAVASGGVRYLNETVIRQIGITEEVIEDATRRQRAEVERREQRLRGGRPFPGLEGKTVILVDDGVATGATMMAALDALRQQNPKRLIAGVPTVARDTLPALEQKADEVVAVLIPEAFLAVGQWYESFTQTTDEEVRAILEKAREAESA